MSETDAPRLTAQIERLIAEWRTKAKADAEFGIAQALKDDREYFGSVNAALSGSDCADQLAALLPAVRERVREQEQLLARLRGIEDCLSGQPHDLPREWPAGETKETTLNVAWSMGYSLAHDSELVRVIVSRADRLADKLEAAEQRVRELEAAHIITPNPDRTTRLARAFAQEWLRPDNPEQATEQLVTTLTVAMTAFFTAARSADKRDARLKAGTP